MNRLLLAASLFLATSLSAQIERFPLPVRSQLPGYLTVGSGGRMWIASADLTTLFRRNADLTITALRAGVGGPVAEAADGSLWVPSFFKVYRLDPESGAITGEVPIRASGVVTGPDGNLWALESAQITKFSPAGVILAVYPLPGTATGDPRVVDGALWLVIRGAQPSLLRMTTSGATTSYPLPFQGVLRETADGFWLVSDEAAARIDRTGNVLGAWSLPLLESQNFRAVAVDAAGDLWLASVNALSRLTDAGILTDFVWQAAPPNPCSAAYVPDMLFDGGALWMIEFYNPPSGISPPGDPCGQPLTDDYLTRVTTSALRVLRERPLPVHGEAHIPALDLIGILVLSTLLCFLGVFRLFGR